MAAAFTDAAVSHNIISGLETLLTFIDGLEFGSRLEGSIFGVDCLRPRHALGAGDVTTTESAFLRVIGHMSQLAAEFIRAADVDQRQSGFDMLQDLITEGTDFGVIAFGRSVCGGGIARY